MIEDFLKHHHIIFLKRALPPIFPRSGRHCDVSMMLKSCFNRTRTKAVLATDVSHGVTWYTATNEKMQNKTVQF
jgi:hypothetical protein